MDKRLLDILCCPTTRTPLRVLNADELAALNRAVSTGQLRNGEGGQVAGPLTDGLITRDGQTIYRIDDDIPVMLASEAIAVAHVADFPRS